MGEPDAIGPSEWSLTFDCETLTDAAQALRFGAYQLRRAGKLVKAGLFHAEEMPADEVAVLRTVAEAEGWRLLTVRQFVEYILFDDAYRLGARIIGFNLPFDISRLAVHHGSARKKMRGGFSFKLSENEAWPRIRVKHVSSRMAFIEFGRVSRKLTPEGQRKRGLSVPHPRGFFVDVRTLAAGLLSGGWSLERLCEALDTATRKADADAHGADLTPAYVRYCMTDVQATWECYERLAVRLASYDLSTISPEKLYSEASLGKAYLRQMGIKPWRETQPDFPPQMIGEIMSTYFGGRAEVHIRREKREVLYCDFLSMYPTVCTLMGLWRFVIAEGITWRDATAETQALLDRVDIGDMLDRSAWGDLTTLVQLRPDDDILPVRARYAEDGGSNIGLNRLSSDRLLWFTLADVIAAKLLGGGKIPIIERAVRFDPKQAQADLTAINIAGKPSYRVEPTDGDFYRRVIDLRQTVKIEMKAPGLPADAKARLQSEQLALKILANATSYGIFIEMLVKDFEKAETLTAYGVEGWAFPVTTNRYEEPGAFFHPLLATLITGAARLMLALAERQASDHGLDWVFCDTDSIAMARSKTMSRDAFRSAALAVCDAFGSLNPYDRATGSILQIEEQNFGPGDHGGDLATAPPLFCFAVSAKRYALFNDGPNGEPIIRKASAHGLGHLLPPYRDDDKVGRAKRIDEIKVDLWQEDLWKRIIAAAADPTVSDGGAAIGLENDQRLDRPVASRYSAATPALLDWFKLYNRRRTYEQQVRPFGFLLSLQSEKLEQLAHSDPEAQAWWKTHKRDPSPTAPYDEDTIEAAKHAFDRGQRDRAVPERWMISYAAALSDYHLHPESKFHGGGRRLGSGILRRRHIVAAGINHIGKEADRWEEQTYIGGEDDEISYGLTPVDRHTMIENIQLARKRFSVRTFTKLAGVTDRTVAAAISGKDLVSDAVLVRLNDVGLRLWAGLRELEAGQIALYHWALERSIEEGTYTFAKRIGIDGSNLAKALARKQFSTGLANALAAASTEAWTNQ